MPGGITASHPLCSRVTSQSPLLATKKNLFVGWTFGPIAWKSGWCVWGGLADTAIKIFYKRFLFCQPFGISYVTENRTDPNRKSWPRSGDLLDYTTRRLLLVITINDACLRHSLIITISDNDRLDSNNHIKISRLTLTQDTAQGKAADAVPRATSYFDPGWCSRMHLSCRQMVHYKGFQYKGLVRISTASLMMEDENNSVQTSLERI